MAWRRSGDKPLSELMMVSLTTHICVTRPQWVNVKTVGFTCPVNHNESLVTHFSMQPTPWSLLNLCSIRLGLTKSAVYRFMPFYPGEYRLHQGRVLMWCILNTANQNFEIKGFGFKFRPCSIFYSCYCCAVCSNIMLYKKIIMKSHCIAAADTPC